MNQSVPKPSISTHSGAVYSYTASDAEYFLYTDECYTTGCFSLSKIGTAKRPTTSKTSSNYNGYSTLSISASHTVTTSGAYNTSSYVRPYSIQCLFLIKY